jgi:signal recognition particle receptor subunit beta
MNQGDDDVVGGAIYTGTANIRKIPAMVQYLKPSQMLLEQGLETKKIARVMVQPGRLTIYERDELEVVGPPGHEELGNLMRVVSVERTGLSPNDSRGRWLVLTCERYATTRDGRVGFQ